MDDKPSDGNRPSPSPESELTLTFRAEHPWPIIRSQATSIVFVRRGSVAPMPTPSPDTEAAESSVAEPQSMASRNASRDALVSNSHPTFPPLSHRHTPHMPHPQTSRSPFNHHPASNVKPLWPPNMKGQDLPLRSPAANSLPVPIK